MIFYAAFTEKKIELLRRNEEKTNLCILEIELSYHSCLLFLYSHRGYVLGGYLFYISTFVFFACPTGFTHYLEIGIIFAL